MHITLLLDPCALQLPDIEFDAGFDGVPWATACPEPFVLKRGLPAVDFDADFLLKFEVFHTTMAVTIAASANPARMPQAQRWPSSTPDRCN